MSRYIYISQVKSNKIYNAAIADLSCLLKCSANNSTNKPER